MKRGEKASRVQTSEHQILHTYIWGNVEIAQVLPRIKAQISINNDDKIIGFSVLESNIRKIATECIFSPSASIIFLGFARDAKIVLQIYATQEEFGP